MPSQLSQFLSFILSETNSSRRNKKFTQKTFCLVGQGRRAAALYFLVLREQHHFSSFRIKEIPSMHLSDFKKSGHNPTLFSAFLYFDVSFMVWVLLGPLAVFITEDFKLTPAQKGLLVALPILGGAAMRLVLGVLTDRIGAKKTALLGLTLTLVPLLWGWLGATSLSELHIVALLLGVAGASFAAALPMASRWY